MYSTERTLEDYEKVYCVYQSMMKFDPATDKRFIFRKDFRKYEMFRNPQVNKTVQVCDPLLTPWVCGHSNFSRQKWSTSVWPTRS